MLQTQFTISIKHLKSILTTILFVAFSIVYSNAQLSNNLIYDANKSQVFGSENLLITHKLIYGYFDKILPHKINSETNFKQKSLGISYRFAKLLLLDFQIDYLFALTQHEVYGHGSRMREFKFRNISYQLNLFPPYGRGGGLARGTPSFYLSKSQSLAIDFSGNEGNLILSNNYEDRMVLSGDIHYRQALQFLISRNTPLLYSSVTHLFGVDGDIHDYVNGINSGTNKYSEKKLFLQNLVVLLNPMQYYSAWAIGKSYLLDGKSKLSRIPMINFGNKNSGSIKSLPSLNFNLTPFGSEFILNNYLKKKNRLLKMQFRLGDPTFHNFYGGSLKLYNLIDNSRIQVHVRADSWFQPEFELGGESAQLEEVSEGIGFLGDVSFTVTPFKNTKNLGFYGSIGYKTNGYVMGEQLKDGAIIRFGLSFKNIEKWLR